MNTARRWRVVGIYKAPGQPRRRIQRTVEARTAIAAVTAHKRVVPPELRRHWLTVEAVLLGVGLDQIGVTGRKRRAEFVNHPALTTQRLLRGLGP